MELEPYVSALRDDLAAAAALGDEHARQTAERLLLALDPAVRMTLVQALSDATAEVTQRLEGTATVDVRLDGRDARLVVDHVATAPTPPVAPVAPAAGEGEEDGTARITLRLPESVKAAADERAAADGISLNAWIVAAVRAATGSPTPTVAGRRGRGRKQLNGWA